jgi:hypothetical protein
MINLEVEKLENKYLKKFYYLLKSFEDELLDGLNTKEEIRHHWEELWQTDISSFSTGAERIVYALFNGKSIGKPNSSPVGSDLFFKQKDAMLHIDLKTVKHSLSGGKTNIGDYKNDIFIGTNQNSYSCNNMLINEGRVSETSREYDAHLPHFYNIDNTDFPCLTYFITILYSEDDGTVLCITIMSMPNGQLENHYEHRVLKAGKNIDKSRYNFSRTPTFEVISNDTGQDFSRIKVVYLDDRVRSELEFLSDLYDSQEN